MLVYFVVLVKQLNVSGIMLCWVNSKLCVHGVWVDLFTLKGSYLFKLIFQDKYLALSMYLKRVYQVHYCWLNNTWILISWIWLFKSILLCPGMTFRWLVSFAENIAAKETKACLAIAQMSFYLSINLNFNGNFM